VKLPKDVQRGVARGKEYFFYQANRGTKQAGPRTPLGKDPYDPEFWHRLNEAKGRPVEREGTLSALIAEFKQHKFTDDKRTSLRPATQRSYKRYLDRLDAEGGDRPVDIVGGPRSRLLHRHADHRQALHRALSQPLVENMACLAGGSFNPRSEDEHPWSESDGDQ
jgi:hypothetical protein